MCLCLYSVSLPRARKTMTSLKNGKKRIDRLRQRLFMLKISTLQLLLCLEYVIESKYANFIQ